MPSRSSAGSRFHGSKSGGSRSLFLSRSGTRHVRIWTRRSPRPAVLLDPPTTHPEPASLTLLALALLLSAPHDVTFKHALPPPSTLAPLFSHVRAFLRSPITHSLCTRRPPLPQEEHRDCAAVPGAGKGRQGGAAPPARRGPGPADRAHCALPEARVGPRHADDVGGKYDEAYAGGGRRGARCCVAPEHELVLPNI